ncbi:hypothetical protein K0M31_006925 [Melipona bicolor]|uniref:Uncharacterized protein n=1 Tax=Melipona bicolor TaxID=60889 RepID=A0AA40KKL4_9HYME|nr:hypothetical protein K0M31_006925 [Melipona bicolor]
MLPGSSKEILFQSGLTENDWTNVYKGLITDIKESKGLNTDRARFEEPNKK